MEFNMWLIVLTFLVFLTQIGDWYTTTYVLRHGGYEANPVIRWLMNKLTVQGALISKGIIVTLTAYFIGHLSLLFPLFTLFVYALVLVHNVKSMKKVG